MINNYEVDKCDECNNTVVVMNNGGGTLVCCGQNMVKMPEQTADSSKEKHVPVIDKVDNGYKVAVGSTEHPMLENHWIQWIELIIDDQKLLSELKPGDKPEAFFHYEKSAKSVSAREYCNVHGLWKGSF